MLVPTADGRHYLAHSETPERLVELPVPRVQAVHGQYVPPHGLVLFLQTGAGVSTAVHAATGQPMDEYYSQQPADKTLERELLGKLREKQPQTPHEKVAQIHRWLEGPLNVLRERMTTFVLDQAGENHRFEWVREINGGHWFDYGDWQTLEDPRATYLEAGGAGVRYQFQVTREIRQTHVLQVVGDFFWEPKPLACRDGVPVRGRVARQPLTLTEIEKNAAPIGSTIWELERRQYACEPAGAAYAEALLKQTNLGRTLNDQGLFPALGRGKPGVVTNVEFLALQLLIATAALDATQQNRFLPRGVRQHNLLTLRWELGRLKALCQRRQSDLEEAGERTAELDYLNGLNALLEGAKP